MIQFDFFNMIPLLLLLLFFRCRQLNSKINNKLDIFCYGWLIIYSCLCVFVFACLFVTRRQTSNLLSFFAFLHANTHTEAIESFFYVLFEDLVEALLSTKPTGQVYFKMPTFSLNQMEKNSAVFVWWHLHI